MTCRCHPNARCGRCDDAELAVEILQAKARDDNKECCAHVDGDMVCVIRKGHAGEHKFERADSIIPFA